MSDAAAAATAAATAAAAAAAAAAGAAGAGAAGVAGARAVGAGAGAGAGAGEQELPGAGAGEQEQELLQHVATSISGARAHDTVVGGEPSQKLADNDISMGVLAVAGHHGGNFHDLDSNACRARRLLRYYT